MQQHSPSLMSPSIRLWLTEDPAVSDAALLAEYQRWLSPEEQARHQRFRFERHRHQFLVSRALLRTVLADLMACEPTDIRYRLNKWGKPALDLPGADDLVFNLSHTDGLIVLAVAHGFRNLELGVDVEHLGRKAETGRLAERYFSPRECADLLALDEAGQRGRFFDLWTLKEAYIKAVGMGLAIPLDAFSFSFDQDRINIAFSGVRAGDDPRRWQFAQWHLPGTEGSEGHQLALALCGECAVDVQILEGMPVAGFSPSGRCTPQGRIQRTP